ncbi:hypothetical protein ACFSTB_18555, partial [Sphingobacterium chuzhouense]|uniref:hypothetical protein n=1 Tax=Sphingobacterium chuzhouense TaxID=1742264 RepID=UPI0036356494
IPPFWSVRTGFRCAHSWSFYKVTGYGCLVTPVSAYPLTGVPARASLPWTGRSVTGGKFFDILG